MRKVEVNGPMYQDIVMGKDLVADILPPPEYIIESYLTVYQLIDPANKDQVPDLIKRMKQLEQDYDTRHEFWVKTLPDGSLKQNMIESSYKPAREFYQIVDAELLPAVRQGNDAATLGPIVQKLTAAYTEHRSAIDRVVSLANDMNSATETKASGQISSGTRNLVVIAVMTLLAVMGLGFIISAQLVGPIRRLSSAARSLAQGNLDNTITVNSKDEVGELAGSFLGLVDYMTEISNAAHHIAINDLTVHVEPKSQGDVLGNAFKTMVVNLNAVVAQLADSSRELVKAASEIASTSEQASRGAKTQADQVNQVSSAIEEMTTTIVESSRNASDATEAAKGASTTATEGLKIVADTIQGMQRIAAVVKESSESISQLASSADKIGEIIGVIDDIADQTNLLALNAAIEAARAGEQGRGFAVVADEVRKLAERTGKATGEITEMIRGIQSQTEGAVQGMGAGIQEVDKGRELADKAGTSLNSIVSMAQRVNDMIVQIATSTDEQSSAAEQISKSVEHITSAARDGASTAQQSSAAAEELNRQADGLRQMVSKFKVKA
jgi:methyl-accepting chemotaxis protein